jgi:Ca-activated chloride channel homolog
MFSRSVYDNSRSGGVGVLEVSRERREGEPAPRQFVPLKRTDIAGDVIGPLATMRVTQTYGYSRLQCPLTLEALYRFPLPGDAAVTGLTVRFGDVEIRADLRPREAAEAEYAEAKKDGKQAALLTREAPDVFTVAVAGIQPDQDVTVVTHYVQLARPDGIGWTLRFPLTTAPRYVRSDETGTRQANGQPLALLRDPGHRFSLDVTVARASSVTSPTYRIESTGTPESQRVRLAAGEEIPDRDCVLRWEPAQDRSRPALQVAASAEAGDGAHVLALVTPPASPEPLGAAPREVIVLVDHSGSMSGAKWQAADWTVEKFLSGLCENDSFALGLFHNTTRWFAPSLSSGTADRVAQAVCFLKEGTDSGGTELGVALEQALAMPRGAGQPSRQVLLITDAEVSDQGRILRLAQSEAERAEARRINIICIDAAPNSFLAAQLAERTGGIARFLTSSPDEEDISTTLDEILADWSQPVLANMTLTVDRPNVVAAGRRVRSTAPGACEIDLGDLPGGRSVWTVFRAGDGPRGLSVGLRSGQRELTRTTADPASASGGMAAVRALFGAWRVLSLEQLLTADYGPDDLAVRLATLGFDPVVRAPRSGGSVYVENRREEMAKAIEALLVREALDHGIVCSATAFVGVRQEKGKQVEATAIVPNALPAGWDDSFLTTGTGALPPMPFSAPPPARFGKRSSVRAVFRSSSSSVAKMANLPFPEATPPAAQIVVFSGTPHVEAGEAVLFDSAVDSTRVPGAITLSRLSIRFVGDPPDAVAMDPGLSILIYVGDLASPRARVTLTDLVRMGGMRPLNIRRAGSEPIRLVLVDRGGAWNARPYTIEVTLA